MAASNIMEIEGRLTYKNCALAPDGGSLGLLLIDEAGNQFDLTLDRAMDTNTYDRIYLDDDRMLGPKEEANLLPKLQQLSGVNLQDPLIMDIVNSFIEAIGQRRA